MAEFSYKARNQGGDEISGAVMAPTENIAYGILRDKNLIIVSLKEKKQIKFLKGVRITGGVRAKEIVVFSRQLSVMISSNVPIVRALKVLSHQTNNNYLKGIINDLADEVDGGAKLSQSMMKYPRVFSNFFVQMVRSAETTGRLDEILIYLADQFEKDYDLKAKARGAMIYPIFIVSALIVVGVAMMMFVLPQITSIFEEGGAELPVTTRMFMAMSDFLLGYWWLLLIIIIGAVIGFRMFSKTSVGRKQIDLLKVRLPIIGPIFSRTYLSRFSRSLSTLITSGVPLTKSLEIVADLVGNTLYHDLTTQTIKEVEAGNSITVVFAKSRDVPLMLSQMMSVGEQSGQLDKILEKVADFYSRELENSLRNLTTLLEPIIMVVIGVAIGFLVSAIILPMYNLSSAI
ncbi:type II secretion system F family protein [Patescibacteria group bacterium]|nr:type II secretion system F family protein [Patescibacteria group bacterium]MBU0964348.1 type II secretion system F family protein [Patescibacteria group bacterium]